MRLRLNKKDKLRFKAQFDRIRRDGVKSAGPAIVAVVMPIPEGRAACGVICSRKYSLKSVVRNRARRLLWESFRMLKPELSPCHILLIPRRKLMDLRQTQVVAELARLLAARGVLPPGCAAGRRRD
ncbi:MAG: ribonuclease P protein component [Lentisphaeria bacterium]|nr:ribonuclease P protein component [Lentisphaeria bacterium]